MLMTMMGFVLAAASPDKVVPDGGDSAEVYKFLGLNNWPSLLFFGIVALALVILYVQVKTNATSLRQVIAKAKVNLAAIKRDLAAIKRNKPKN